MIAPSEAHDSVVDWHSKLSDVVLCFKMDICFLFLVISIICRSMTDKMHLNYTIAHNAV